MSTMTLTQALARHDISVADELLANIEVPVLGGVQRQGDVLIVPRGKLGAAERASMRPIPSTGVPVVRGEATGNTHLLDAITGVCRWAPHTASVAGDVTLGVLEVPDDGLAALIHTDEHGCNMIAPGVYVLHGKRELAQELRRVQD